MRRAKLWRSWEEPNSSGLGPQTTKTTNESRFTSPDEGHWPSPALCPRPGRPKTGRPVTGEQHTRVFWVHVTGTKFTVMCSWNGYAWGGPWGDGCVQDTLKPLYKTCALVLRMTFELSAPDSWLISRTYILIFAMRNKCLIGYTLFLI